MEFKRFDYEIKNKGTYYVYAIKNNDVWEYWLQNSDYGVMLLIHGIYEYDMTLVEKNLSEYIETYEEYIED